MREPPVPATRILKGMKSLLGDVLWGATWTLIVIMAMVTAFLVGLALGNSFKQPPPKDPYCVGVKC